MKRKIFILFFIIVSVNVFAEQSIYLTDAYWQTAQPEQVQLALATRTIKLNIHNDDGETAFMFAVRNSTNPQVISELLKAGANLGERSNFGTSPLMFAAESNPNLEVIKLLLQEGAPVKDMDAEGWGTPLMYAIYGAKNYDTITLLLKSGADINEQSKYGTTPLMIAADHNDSKMVKFLLQLGAKIDARDDYGLSPLMYAARTNLNTDVFETLIQAGAKIDERDTDGKTALTHAISNNNTVAIKLLSKYDPQSLPVKANQNNPTPENKHTLNVWLLVGKIVFFLNLFFLL